jgi:hypothetical protein
MITIITQHWDSTKCFFGFASTVGPCSQGTRRR